MKQNLLLLFLLLLFSTSFAQSNQWTWMSGDNIPGQKSIFGLKGVAAPTYKPAARSGAISWADASGDFWLFGGGYGSGGYLNDLWKYTSASGLWTWISGDTIPGQFGIYGTKGLAASGNKPPGRNYAVSWTDVSGNLWLFGGETYSASGTGLLNDLWKFTPATGLWTWMSGDNTVNQAAVYGTRGVSNTANKPGAGFDAVSWTDTSGNLWLFGGSGLTAGSSGFLNDLWKYIPSSGEWTWMSGDSTTFHVGIYGAKGAAAPANRPGARTRPVSWADAAGNMWLFGGLGNTSSNIHGGYLNDLWKYMPSSGQWTWVSGDSVVYSTAVFGSKGTAAPGNKPGGRNLAVSWIDAMGNMWLFGGLGEGTNANLQATLNDLWKYTPSTGWWTWESGDSTFNTPEVYGVYGTKGTAAPTNKPGARAGANSWTDISGNLWLFGGSGFAIVGAGYLNDLWKYTLSNSSTSGLSSNFTAQKLQQAVVLNWSSSPDQNISSFSIERYNGTVTGYQSIGTVPGTASSSRYSFIDNAPLSGTNFYRIRQIDQTGSASYSSTAHVDMSQYSTQFSVYQNPVQNVLRLIVQLPTKQKLILQVRDMNGHVLVRQEQTGYPSRASFSVPVDRLNKGTYLIQVQSESINNTKTFIKQ